MVSPMSATTSRDGQTIGFEDHGGTGPTVVLLHSFLMDGSMFAPQVAALGDRFRLVAVDERGHGATPADGPFDFWEVADDVLAVLDALDVERAALIGTSQGGFVALRVALRAAERVSALAVFGSSAAAEDPEVAAQYRQIAAAWRDSGPVDQLVDTIAAICLGPMDAEEHKARWRTVDADRFDRILDALVERDDLRERLASISAPALVMHGDQDAAYPVERAHEMAGALPGADEAVIVEGGHHFLSLTDADAVNARLGPFLREHAA